MNGSQETGLQEQPASARADDVVLAREESLVECLHML